MRTIIAAASRGQTGAFNECSERTYSSKRIMIVDFPREVVFSVNMYSMRGFFQ